MQGVRLPIVREPVTTKPVIVVYVAGPISAETGYQVEMNIRAAEEVARDLLNLGFAPICPHSFERFHQGLLDYDDWMRVDLEILSRCDAIFMVHGWEGSKGSMTELNWAHQNDYPIFYTLNQIKKWSSTFVPEEGIEYD